MYGENDNDDNDVYMGVTRMCPVIRQCDNDDHNHAAGENDNDDTDMYMGVARMCPIIRQSDNDDDDM